MDYTKELHELINSLPLDTDVEHDAYIVGVDGKLYDINDDGKLFVVKE